jgi:hypothetical protein
MEKLPRELKFNILRCLDIDSRRHLGIFTKLKVPEYLRTELGNVFKKRVSWQHGPYWTTNICIGPRRGDSTTYRFVHSNWCKPLYMCYIHRTTAEEDCTNMERPHQYILEESMYEMKHMSTTYFKEGEVYYIYYCDGRFTA